MPDGIPLRRREGGGLRILLIGCAVLLTVVAAAFIWLGLRVVTAATHLDAARDAGERAAQAVAADDPAGLADAAGTLTRELAAAREVAADPTWAVAGLAPVLGGDLAAVQTLAGALGAAAVSAEPLVDALRTGGLQPATAGAAMAPLAAQAARADALLRGIDTGTLLPPVAGAVERTRSLLHEALPTLQTAAALAPLASVAEGDAPVTVLVMIQNNAELRTGGGITGSFLQLTAHDGTFTLDAQASSADFAARSTPVAPVPDALTALYGDVVGRFVQNASMPTDFTLTARLAAAWWTQRGGAAPDLVLSVDPMVLVAALRVVGPVDLGDGTTITADDALTRLLVDPYRTLDTDGQTRFMQDAAARVFARMVAAPPDPLAWGAALAGPVSDGRVSAWSADPQVQSALAASALGGPAARHRLAGDEAYAVSFNDGTGGKMGVYLDVGLQVGAAQCRADGRADVIVRLTMTSTAPLDAATSLPGDVTGRGMFGTGVGDIGTTVAVAAPPGTLLSSVTKAGAPVVVAQADEGGFPTSALRVNLSPQERNVVEFRFVAASPGAAAPVLLHTPMATTPRPGAAVPVSCG
ncbi:DUF4012 domain-containing protein [Microbacterium sp. W1N]|uniref:DUF4012 domain-containing protein n=1 Tax=Microbacterium festucae TaxID=2977531 RepID=UPI0021C007E9|nr:DUF4012 domain-containing protein [Microbacterium festucae]MCT9820048.1 DUF4012 domain-containing protein [Microbacterium festucae]